MVKFLTKNNLPLNTFCNVRGDCIRMCVWFRGAELVKFFCSFIRSTLEGNYDAIYDKKRQIQKRIIRLRMFVVFFI